MYCNKFRLRRNFVVVCIFIFCLTQLSGCSFIGGTHKGIDGPPKVDIDVTKISDAVPKVEPYHPYGTRDYVVGGRHYHVLKTSKGYIKRGYASWYGSNFHGNHTSTQERFNLYGMTAASPELPLPSYVQVTNLRNGKTVVVRVNDRGPFHSNRILDLSYAAAKKLGFVDHGTAPVKIVAIDPKTWEKGSAAQYAASKPKSTKKYAKSSETYLQVGAFSQLNNAKQLSNKIAKLIDKPTKINQSDNLYRVQVGPLACATQGDQLKQLLEENGVDKVVVVAN